MPFLWRWAHLFDPRFPGTAEYWETRYRVDHGNSGCGSYGRLADFKAEIINAFVAERGIRSVAEFGCGDGNQLRLARYPRYIGFDISPTAVAQCVEMFRDDSSKSFFVDTGALDLPKLCAGVDLALSLDVIYHLVEEGLFQRYMQNLFLSSSKFVIIYSSDFNQSLDNVHVRHWKFTDYVKSAFPDWRLDRKIPNRYPIEQFGDEGTWSDFFIFRKATQG